MQKAVKACFFTISIFFFQISTYSQTYVSPLVGINLSKIDEEGDVNSFFEIFEKGYTIESLVYGLKIDQQISNKFSLSLRGAFSKKKVPAYVDDFFPLNGFIYKRFRTSITINWQLKKSWSIGIGPTLSSLIGVEKNNWSSSEPFYNESKKEYSLLLLTGYSYKKILVELKYFKGLKMTSIGRSSNLLKPINSFEISLGYKFKVLKGNVRKRRR